jgi:hypothetical protein
MLLATLLTLGAVAALPAVARAASVSLTAQAATESTYSWAIEKTADTTAVTVSGSQTFTVNYTVVVTPSLASTSWSAQGTLVVTNDQPVTQTLEALEVDVAGVGPATVTCPAAIMLPHPLDPGEDATCDWEVALPDAATRVATATATLDGADSSTTATIDFATTTVTEIDECADVYDLNVDLLGSPCAAAGPTTFVFPVMFGPLEECVSGPVENIAWFEAVDTLATDEDAWAFELTCVSNTPCGEVKGDGRISTNVNFDYTFYNVKFANGVMKSVAEISFVDTRDRQNKVRFWSTSIDTWVIAGNVVTLTGTGLVNGTIPVTFVVVATDGGAGGTDTFSITLSNGYSASGEVTTGRGVTIKPC